MNRANITTTPSPVAMQSPMEQRITTVADERITDHIPADERITDRLVHAPSRWAMFRPATLFGRVQALRRWLARPEHRFTVWTAGMGMAFAFLAGKITLIMALRERHPFLIGVASFFACGSIAYFSAAAWSFFRMRRASRQERSLPAATVSITSISTAPDQATKS
jgi:hypothetical protein